MLYYIKSQNRQNVTQKFKFLFFSSNNLNIYKTNSEQFRSKMKLKEKL